MTRRFSVGYTLRYALNPGTEGLSLPGFDSLRQLMEGIRGAVTVVDVSARDGLQAEPAVLPPPVRARWVHRLLAAGVPEVEAGSFVHPGRVPQMAGTDRVLAELGGYEDRLWVLVPNARGLDAALEAGARRVVCVLSATETHSRDNLGRTMGQVLSDLEAMAPVLADPSVRARASLSVAWVDPQEGRVPADRVVDIAHRLREIGFTELNLCDTYGAAPPGDVAGLVARVADVYPPDRVGLHLHDTFGLAGAGVLAGALAGVRRFDGSVGGLGGCPFAPGAKGNLDLSTLVRILASLGLDTGVDPDAIDRAWDACRRDLGG